MDSRSVHPSKAIRKTTERGEFEILLGKGTETNTDDSSKFLANDYHFNVNLLCVDISKIYV